MKISTGAKVDMSIKELYIAFLFLILLCELAGRDPLINRAGLIIGVKRETISETCLTF